MDFSHHFLSIKKSPILPYHKPSALFPITLQLPVLHPNSPASQSSRLALSQTLQSESLKTLEWSSVCQRLSSFTSTSMGRAAAQAAGIPFGRTLAESRKLLNQTTTAVTMMRNSQRLDLSGIEDVSEIVNSAVRGELLTVGELCAVGRTLRAARGVLEKLEASAMSGDYSDRYGPLYEILQDCNFQMELERKIGFCIDCNLSIIFDRASEELEVIRSERKRNMKSLDSLLKEVSVQIFQAGGIDRPLITKRRSRLCVGIRASHRYLLSGGVVLNVSSSGATYFMEPKEAVDLNNLEVKLSNLEATEERAILSLLSSEIAEAEIEIKYLLDRIQEVDLAFAKAAYAQWMNGVCPFLSSEGCETVDSSEVDHALSVNIEGIKHPLLLESSLSTFSDSPASSFGNSVHSDEGNDVETSQRLSEGSTDFPVPIDIKIGSGTKVVVISGPNTGGKTASMKTLGLASLMSKAGMYLPAKNNPRLPWFDLVLADIGDHQSLEQNLSTFSGHISGICKILEVASKESLVLIDEIGSGTDPSEGVALSASILQYLKDRVNLAVITTHYADLSRLKEKDTRFENAAMEFSLETLQPTYRILWGSTGDSNALSIAKSIGFDRHIIEHAQKWVERLMPEKQLERKGLLYQSLMEERNRLEAQARRATSLHADIMNLYHEIQAEAEDLDKRESALRAKETHHIQQELKAAKSQIETVVQEFENRLRTAGADQFNAMIKKSESTIASILEAHCPGDGLSVTETNINSYTPQFGEQVFVKGLGDKLATVVEAPGEDATVLVQYGKIRIRVKKSNIKAIAKSKSNVATNSIPRSKRQGRQRREFQNHSEANENEVSYGPLVQTSKNTVDLRGMRVEEAAHFLNTAISASGPHSVLFIVHGMGTGVVKECALGILRKHPRVTKYEQESSMNYGCTVAYVK